MEHPLQSFLSTGSKTIKVKVPKKSPINKEKLMEALHESGLTLNIEEIEEMIKNAVKED